MRPTPPKLSREEWTRQLLEYELTAKEFLAWLKREGPGSDYNGYSMSGPVFPWQAPSSWSYSVDVSFFRGHLSFGVDFAELDDAALAVRKAHVLAIAWTMVPPGCTCEQAWNLAESGDLSGRCAIEAHGNEIVEAWKTLKGEGRR